MIGVLYLDGRERGVLLSPETRSSLEAFATLSFDRYTEALAQHQVAALHAMRGRFDRAFALLQTGTCDAACAGS